MFIVLSSVYIIFRGSISNIPTWILSIPQMNILVSLFVDRLIFLILTLGSFSPNIFKHVWYRHMSSSYRHDWWMEDYKMKLIKQKKKEDDKMKRDENYRIYNCGHKASIIICHVMMWIWVTFAMRVLNGKKTKIYPLWVYDICNFEAHDRLLVLKGSNLD